MVAAAKLFGLVAALATATNAVVVTLYSDDACKNVAGTRNVYDNSCATGLPGYQSFIITTGSTDPGQQVTAWSRDACAGPTTACISGTNLNVCTRAVNGAGGSNAMSSAPNCATV